MTTGNPYVDQTHFTTGAQLTDAGTGTLLGITSRRHLVTSAGFAAPLINVPAGLVGDRVTLVRTGANRIAFAQGGAADTKLIMPYGARIDLATAGDEITLEYAGAGLGWVVVSYWLASDYVHLVDALAALPALGRRMQFTSRTADPTTITGGVAGRRLTLQWNIAAGTAVVVTHNDAQDGILCPNGRSLTLTGTADVVELEHNGQAGAASRWVVTGFNLLVGVGPAGAGTVVAANPLQLRCKYARFIHTDLMPVAPGLVNDVNVGTVMPAGAHVVDAYATLIEAFAAPAVATLVVSIGIAAGNRDHFRGDVSIWPPAVVGSKLYGQYAVGGWVDAGGAQIQVRATATVANLNTLTDGTVDVSVLYLVVPAVPVP